MRWVGHRALQSAAFAMLLLAGTHAYAQADVDAKRACVRAYERAQEHRGRSELLKARQQLRTCSGSACPDFVQADCSKWLDEVERDLPSLVFAASLDGKDADDVTVELDGKETTRKLDGKPVQVDPGVHLLRFRRRPFPDVEQKVLAKVGDRNRIIVARFLTPKAREAPAVPTHRPIPWTVWATAGVAVVGLAGFATFSLLGEDKRSELERTCKPFCTNAQKEDVRSLWTVGDISLAVGLVAAAGSVTLYLTRPEVPLDGSESLALTLTPFPLGWQLRGSF